VNADELKPAPDLMAALKETLRRSAKEVSGTGRSRKELYEQARREDVPGRSSMSKQELIEALDG
jgi:hypothetical protein